MPASIVKARETTCLTPLMGNMRIVFAYLRDNLATARFVAPSNTNNIISDDLTVAEKQAIRKAAASALAAPHWRDIVV